MDPAVLAAFQQMKAELREPLHTATASHKGWFRKRKAKPEAFTELE